MVRCKRNPNPNRKSSKQHRKSFYQRFREHPHFALREKALPRALQVAHGLFVEKEELRKEVQDLKGLGVVESDLVIQQQQQIEQLQAQVQALQIENQGLRLLPIVTQLHSAQVELEQVRSELDLLNTTSRADITELRRINNILHGGMEDLRTEGGIRMR